MRIGAKCHLTDKFNDDSDELIIDKKSFPFHRILGCSNLLIGRKIEKIL